MLHRQAFGKKLEYMGVRPTTSLAVSIQEYGQPRPGNTEAPLSAKMISGYASYHSLCNAASMLAMMRRRMVSMASKSLRLSVAILSSNGYMPTAAY